MGQVRGLYDVVDNSGIAERALDLRLTSTPAQQNLPEQYFLFVGRLAEEKNVDGLLCAWISYRMDGGSWPLVLVGDGPEKTRLMGIAGQSGYADQVIFAGHKGSAEMGPYQSFARCFVLPSTREPWGLVVNEAMASGLPVLASTHCGCAEDLVDEGRNGYTFDPCSPSDLTALLHHMSRLSEEARKTMGRTSETIIAAYTPQRFGQEIASVLRESGRACHDLSSQPLATVEL